MDDLVINPKKDFIVGSAGGDGRLSLYNTSSKTTMRKHEFSKTIPLKKCSINADSSLLGAALGNDYAGGFE